MIYITASDYKLWYPVLEEVLCYLRNLPLPQLKFSTRQRLTITLFGVLAILLIGIPVGQAQTVIYFTILGPRVVLDDDQNSGVTFTVYVAATDANWRPILPVSSATIALTAYEAGTQNQLT